MKKFMKIENLGALVDFGFIDYCYLKTPCPYNNMVCKNCPFSHEYRQHFSRYNITAKLQDEFLKVHCAATFVNRNVFVSFNDKLTLRSFY